MPLRRKRSSAGMGGSMGSAGSQKKAKHEYDKVDRLYTAAEVEEAVIDAQVPLIGRIGRQRRKIGDFKHQIKESRFENGRLQDQNEMLKLATHRSDGAWNGQAGLLLIQSYSIDRAPKVDLESLGRNGIARTLKKEIYRKLEHVCQTWRSNAKENGTLHGGSFITSLAQELEGFFEDIDLLASLPNGRESAAILLIQIGTFHVLEDRPLLVGANYDPGTNYYLEALAFFQRLDQRIRSLLVEDLKIFGDDLDRINRIINFIRKLRQAEGRLRFAERQRELAKSFGYNIEHQNEFEDDEAFHGQGIEDLTEEEAVEFDRQFDILNEAMYEGRLCRWIFRWTLSYLKVWRDYFMKCEADKQEEEKIAAEEEARCAEADAKWAEGDDQYTNYETEESGTRGDDTGSEGESLGSE